MVLNIGCVILQIVLMKAVKYVLKRRKGLPLDVLSDNSISQTKQSLALKLFSCMGLLVFRYHCKRCNVVFFHRPLCPVT